MRFYLSESLKQLKHRKFKAFIIILSISIGISAFIGITSIGEGIRVSLIVQIAQSEDLSLIRVKAGYHDGITEFITDYKCEYIKEMSHVLHTCLYISDAYVLQTLDIYFRVIGVDLQDFRHVFNPTLQEGSWFAPNSSEVVLGHSIAQKFKIEKNLTINDNISAKIRIYESGGGYHDKDVNLTIKGIMMQTEQQLDDQNFDNLVFLDLSIAKENAEKTIYDGLLVKVIEPIFSLQVKDMITTDLGLSATCPQDEIVTVNNFMSLITMGLGFFSSITLLLGVLMIITITTITIYERTKEIGIMKALGASDLNIMQLILHECAILGVISGILGMIGGIFFAMVIDIVSKPLIGIFFVNGFYD
ncbi:MAG: ABC transporter permease [Promethearchaeota archaeon]